MIPKKPAPHLMRGGNRFSEKIMLHQPVGRDGESTKSYPALVTCGVGGALRARAPHVNTGEEEEPDHIDEMPVPSRELEAEMLSRGKMAEIDADQADDQERGADDDVGTVESRRHEEGGAIDVAAEIEA